MIVALCLLAAPGLLPSRGTGLPRGAAGAVRSRARRGVGRDPCRMTQGVRYEGVTFTYPGRPRPPSRTSPWASPRARSRSPSGEPARESRRCFALRTGSSPTSPAGRSPAASRSTGRSTLDHAPRQLADVVAFVPQDPDASFVLDIVEDELAYSMENLAEAPDRMPPPRRVRDARPPGPRVDQEPKRPDVSGGERQRVAIGRRSRRGRGSSCSTSRRASWIHRARRTSSPRCSGSSTTMA